jgi:hypothetical protein
MMKFLKRFFINLAIMVGIIIFLAIFIKIFYPEALEIFSGVGEVFSALNLWIMIILCLIISAIPKRK